MECTKTTKKKLVLIGISACLFGVMGMPLVLADTGLPVDVGEPLTFQLNIDYEIEGNSTDWNEDAGTYSFDSKIILVLGNARGNFHPPGSIDDWFWLNWSYYYNDTQFETTFTDEDDFDDANRTAYSRGFSSFFSMNRPCSYYFERDFKLPILMNDTLWANFTEDAQALQQISLDYSGDVSYDANSIRINKSSSSPTYNSTFETYIKYSSDGICSEFLVSHDAESLNALATYTSSWSYTLSRLPSTIPGFTPLWLGMMIAGSLIGVVWNRRTRRR